MVAVVAAAAVAQQPPQAQVAPPRPPAVPAPVVAAPTIVVSGNIEWIERAAVASKRPGVVEYVELSLGREAKKGEKIAFLNAEMAILERERAELNSRNSAGVQKAEAQKEHALAEMARIQQIRGQLGRNGISDAEVSRAEAELKLAEATVIEEQEKLKVAKKELELADQAVQDHIIVAPFDGKILQVDAQPGEAVQAMEPVLHLGRTDQVRFMGHVPLESVFKLKEGMIVDVTPVVDGIDHPIESKRFRGKLLYIGSELISARNSAEVQIKADILNNLTKDLRIGHKAEMTIYLDPSQAPPPPEDMLPEQPKAAAPALGRLSDPRPGTTQARADR
jgi:RND family efflux transporter MFP subunit